MRRLALAFVVALLTFSASGVSSVVIDEPCVVSEVNGKDDGACPPMCVTCGCCARAAEPAYLVVATCPDLLVADIGTFLHRLPRTDPSDILHVPKPRLA